MSKAEVLNVQQQQQNNSENFQRVMPLQVREVWQQAVSYSTTSAFRKIK